MCRLRKNPTCSPTWLLNFAPTKKDGLRFRKIARPLLSKSPELCRFAKRKAVKRVQKRFRSDDMFCPKCSQEQASDEIRYCSRCGFQLNVVKALLISDGVPGEEIPRSVSRGFSKRDMSLGALLMFIF